MVASAWHEPQLMFAPGFVLDHYEIIRALGAGGMGQVFLSRDLKLGRLVALKVLHPTQQMDATRVLVEARATAKCRHENIVVIHDMNLYQGLPYLVLEYLEGHSLRHIYKDDVPLAQALDLFCGVLRALEAAHAVGIIHRDLKPDNVFVTVAGVPKVLDFGIAKLQGVPAVGGAMGAAPPPNMDDSETYATLGGNGPVGTWSYMSPEQFHGTDVDGRADLWAIGIMLFKLIAGQHPYGKLEASALMACVGDTSDPTPSILDFEPDLDPDVAQIIDRALRKRRDERFPTARAMLDAIQAHLGGLPVPHVAEKCPYPGLQSFEETDADRFFGRATEVSRAIARLESAPLLAIVGPSGAGKSSFVRAGVVPQLKRMRAWETFAIRPGRSPLASLAQVVGHITGRSDPEFATAVAQQLVTEPGYLGSVLRWRAQTAQLRVMLLVDQLEELYTLVADAKQRVAFVAALCAAGDDPSSPVRVVVSLRSDFLDRAAEDRPFMDAITDGLHYLMPLGRDGLREALTKPLQQASHAFEHPQLVERMIDDIAETPGALPLLQFAAAQMWETRDQGRRVLTQESYVRMGGIAGTLAAHADSVMAGMAWERRLVARVLFRRLVTADGTRAIVDVGELVALDPAEVPALLQRLIAARLLVSNIDQRTSGATIEIVHESLITAWPQLHQWLESDRDEAAFLTQLRQAAQQWEQRGRPNGLLWRGEMAEEARRFAARLGDTLGGRETAFLTAVRQVATRSSRIKRIAVISTIVGLALLVVAAGAVVIKVRGAEQTAVSEADAATKAKTELAEQLRVVNEKEEARIAAQQVADEAAVKAAAAARREAEASKKADAAGADAQESRAELQRSNQRLKEALAAAQDAVVKEQQARAQVQRLLDGERARVKDLERQRKKIATDLR